MKISQSSTSNCFTLFLLLGTVFAQAQQNVGIGTSQPAEARLVVTGGAVNSQALFGKGANSVSIESNPATIGFNNYMSSAGTRKFTTAGYAGQIKYDNTLGRLSITSTSANGVAEGNVLIINPLLSLSKEGYLGLNTSTEKGIITTRGTVGAVAALFGDNSTGVAIENSYPGIGLNTYYNDTRKFIASGFGGLISHDPVIGNFVIYTSATSGIINNAANLSLRMMISKTGNVGLEGNDNPEVALSFAALIGKKISLYRGATGDAGFGVFGNELRINSDNNAAAITFGYDNLTNGFTERMRVTGAGNVGIGYNTPAFKLDVNGRMRLRHGGEGAGLWFNKNDETQGTFIGTYDNTNFGIWGPGAVGSWKFLFDGSDGVLRVGTTKKAAGYLVNVGGKIIAEEVRVTLQAAWPDYVFENTYNLMPLEDLEQHILQNKHLPNIPKATTLENEGIALGDMQTKIMEKVEELSLYIIELNKKLKEQESEINLLKKQPTNRK